MSRTLGHYTILGEIGRGGMAVVYRAVQESLNRTVALKELDLSRFRSEPTVLERFRLEASSAAALDHPNIITIYDLWEDEDKAYIAMEFIDGVELKEVLVLRGSLDFVSAARIAIEICGALDYAHMRGMIHRDVKPGNIMLSMGGDVRLMDFGIVSVSGMGDLTITGQVLGTPAYMSPEQIAGEELGPGVDIFSLGVVLYEMLTGTRPFSNENQLALIQQILHHRPVPPVELAPEVPVDLSDAVLACLAKDPEGRYTSMEELGKVLTRTLPPDAQAVDACVSELVKQTVKPDLNVPDTASAGTEDTSIIRPGPDLNTGEFIKPSASGEADPAVTSMEMQGGIFSADGSDYGVHPLELDPPADLPPLELSGGKGDTKSIPVTEEQEISLSLKEVPVTETEDGEADGIPSGAKGRRGWQLLWLLPVILIIVAAVWKYSGRSVTDILPRESVLPTGPAQLMVVAEPGAMIFMDGEFLGEVTLEGAFEVEPGLHTIVAQNSQLGERKFIVEIEPGGTKKIEVRFGE
jgi:serine/threonine protein kinase